MDKLKFGLFIKNSRIKNGYTQKELADLLFLDVTTVSKWERGVNYPDITLIPDLCKYLNINEHELIESSIDTEYRKMKEESNKYNKQKDLIFIITSILYSISILTCFIVNLSVNKKLNWFFIVLFSIITSYTFIPTILRFFKKYKFEVFIISTLVSLSLLFLVLSIYTKNYWCFIAIISTLFFYFILFYPILFNRQKLYLKEDKYNNIKRFFFLSYTITSLILTLILLMIINNYYPFNLGKSLLITLYVYVIFIVYSVFPLLKLEKNLKIGLAFYLTIIYLYFLAHILSFFIDNRLYDYRINFKEFDTYQDGNNALIVFLSMFFIGSIFILISLIKKIKNNK